MKDYIKGPKEAEQEGRSDTQKKIENLRAARRIMYEYAFRRGRNAFFNILIVGIFGLLGFFYFLVFRHMNFFLAALLGLVVYVITSVLYTLFHMALLKLISRKK